MTTTHLSRRRLMQTGLLATAAASFGPAFWRDALAASATKVGDGPYGPLQAADANGIKLPAGFTSREIARGGQVMPGGYVFPGAPDGQAAFATPDGGWILATNSEIGGGAGGVSATRFASNGVITDSYRICGGTSVNCAGGPTPWGTWLTCEEVPDGFVWECDPTGARAAVKHETLGKFQHEAACVDPIEQRVYLTEDVGGGGLYRFTPTAYPDLTKGKLEIACDGGGGLVTWTELPNPQGGAAQPTRTQLGDSLKFARGEGIWFDAGIVYVATTTDETIHAYETATKKLSVLYKAADVVGTPLKGVDNVHVSRSGDVFVAEDSYDNDTDAMDVCMITPEGEVARFLKLTGDQHFRPVQSETIGVCFDPSGTRMYLGSQRGFGAGVVYEISGPFRQTRPTGTVPGGGTATPNPATPPGGNPAGGGPGPVRPGAPLGLDVAKKLGIAALTDRGLPIRLTVDAACTVRATLTITESTGKGKKRTTTLASLKKTVDAGPETLRLRPGTTKLRRSLRARRRTLTAKLEIRITTPGAAEQLLTRTVRLTPVPRAKISAASAPHGA